MTMTDEERKAKANASKLAYYRRNANKLNADRCEWDQTHRDQANARHRCYYAVDPRKYTQRSLAWVKAHPEAVAKQRAIYYRAHREKVAERQAVYTRSHPMLVRLKVERHRALKYVNTPTDELLTSAEWLAILAEANGHCHYCGKEAKLTMDHVIPLSKGGKHSKDNVVAACGHCNSSKSNKTLAEWAAVRSMT